MGEGPWFCSSIWIGLMTVLAQHSSDNVSPGGVICHTFQNKQGCLVVSDQALLYLVSGCSSNCLSDHLLYLVNWNLVLTGLKTEPKSRKMFDIKALNLLGWNKTLQKKNALDYGILNFSIFLCSKQCMYNIYKNVQLWGRWHVNTLEASKLAFCRLGWNNVGVPYFAGAPRKLCTSVKSLCDLTMWWLSLGSKMPK